MRYWRITKSRAHPANVPLAKMNSAWIAIAAIGWFALDRIRTGKNSQDKLQTEAASLGDLNVTVDADGVVRSNQSAQLNWQTSGMVDQVGVSLGDSVSTSQILASLDKTTLPQGVILAQADLVNAQRALEDLQSSRTRSAQARQKVEDAQQALDDALNPAGIQADARQKLAEAQKAAGADMLYMLAENFDVCGEGKNAMCFGPYIDFSEFYPGAVMASFLTTWDPAYEWALKEWVKAKETGVWDGKPYGFENSMISGACTIKLGAGIEESLPADVPFNDCLHIPTGYRVITG